MRHELQTPLNEPCERCNGTGLVTLRGLYYGGDADDQPCPECTERREAEKRWHQNLRWAVPS